jgi:hypothetical protein
MYNVMYDVVHWGTLVNVKLYVSVTTNFFATPREEVRRARGGRHLNSPGLLQGHSHFLRLFVGLY